MNLIRKYTMKYLWHKYSTAYRARRVDLNYSPREAWIEPTNHCNLRCVMCPQSTGHILKKGFMDLTLYKKILAELKRLKVQRINLFMGGESLVNKNIIEMMRMAGDAGIPVRLHTNATLLTKDIASKLLDCRSLEEISFSFDGEDKDYYERVRVNAKYERTLENIKGFLELKKARGAKRPRTLIQVIKERRPDGKPPEVTDSFRGLFKGLPVDKFHPICFHNFAGTLQDNSDVKYAIEQREYKPCRHPWKSLCVAWNGEVVGCCIDLESKLVLGDLNKQTVMEVWQSEPMKNFRKIMAEERHMELELCKECDMVWR